MNVFLDFETRSLISLPDVGEWRYAEDPSTYPLILAAEWLETGRRLQWVHQRHGEVCPNWVRQIAEDDDLLVHAHNANFEIAIWTQICVERWHWPDIPRHRWRDTAAKSVHANRPRALANVGKALRLKTQKDKKGKELIKYISQPRRAVKKTGQHNSVDRLQSKGVDLFKLSTKEDAPFFYWENDRRMMDLFAKYCEQDVKTEIAVDEALPGFTGVEQDLWTLDSEINQRGIPIDLELCEAAVELADQEKHRASVGIRDLTDGLISSPKQYARMVKWIGERDPDFGNSVAQNVIDDWFENHYNPLLKPHEEINKLFYWRDILGGAAIAKYAAGINYACSDNRVRGQMLYHKASTGRWAGYGVQPHNFARKSIPSEDVFDLIKTADYNAVRDYCEQHKTHVSDLLKSSVRGLIRAPEGRKLVISDFAGIENRVLMWLVGDWETCKLLKDPKFDNYVRTASKVFDIPYDEMMGVKGCKPEYKDKRFVGKTATLGLGYGMGWRKYQITCVQQGVALEDEFAEEVVGKWRAANPLVTNYWRRIEKAVKDVIRHHNPGYIARVKNDRNICVRVGYDSRDYVWIELPSGRRLWYPEARLKDGSMIYKDGGKNVGFETYTYGGKLVENIVQAIARDVLVNSMMLAEIANLYVIMHVHDELVCEQDENDKYAKQYLHQCMTTLPEWAPYLPLDAETYESRRYDKR